MKKVAFLCCLFCGLITQAVGTTYNCKPEGIGSFVRDRSEYLFVDESNYDEGIALVCGGKGTDGCEHGTMVYLFGEYYFQGSKHSIHHLYKCDTSDGGYWEKMLRGTDVNKCSEADKAKLKKVIIPYSDYDYYAHDVKYGSGYVLVDGLCYERDDWIPENKRTDPYATKKDSEKKPAQGAKQKQPGDAGENEEDKWLEPCSEEDLLKVPHAKEGRYIYKTKDEIVCAATACEAGYYLVRNAEGKSQGWCKYGTDPYATTNASETTSGQGASSSDASGTGATGADATGAGTSGAGTSTQKQSIDTGTSLMQSQTSRVRALTQKIENAASQLDSISSRFKVSGWKDAEGKFNTARLASDSIAGVVLGTAGGLITSHVVKKNQVENGFQDIKCTIGGQSVANWGDEFSVGIQ